MPILMDAAGLRAVQAQLDGPRRKAARMAALSALKRCANNSQQLTVDMAGEPWWRDYVASQEVAEQMAAVGITGFTAQRMLYVKDPIYRSRTRVYFIVPVADGSQWRLHPGSMIKSAAVIPKHITAVSEGECSSMRTWPNGQRKNESSIRSSSRNRASSRSWSR